MPILSQAEPLKPQLTASLGAAELSILAIRSTISDLRASPDADAGKDQPILDALLADLDSATAALGRFRLVLKNNGFILGQVTVVGDQG